MSVDDRSGDGNNDDTDADDGNVGTPSNPDCDKSAWICLKKELPDWRRTTKNPSNTDLGYRMERLDVLEETEEHPDTGEKREVIIYTTNEYQSPENGYVIIDCGDVVDVEGHR